MGLSWTELLIVGIVALIVIGPKELPALMNRLGKMAATVRRLGQDFQREINKTTNLNEVKNLRDSIANPLKATADSIRKEFNTTTASGATVPSGALKPADPKAESVVAEIKQAAGIVDGKPAAHAVPAPSPLPPAADAAAMAAPAPAKSGAAAKKPASKPAPPAAKKPAVKAERVTLAEQVSPPRRAPRKRTPAVEAPAAEPPPAQAPAGKPRRVAKKPD